MEAENQNPTPQDETSQNLSESADGKPMDEPTVPNAHVQTRGKMLSLRQAIFFACLLLAAAILLTYTLTAGLMRKAYTQKLLEQQAVIDRIEASTSEAADNMQLLETIIGAYSYYADALDGEAMLEAAFKAYVEASGDRYAQYYNEQEYLELLRSNNAELCGIGVGVVQKSFQMQGQNYLSFQITEIYEGSTALTAGLQVGDHIYAVYVDGVCKTVSELDYLPAMNSIRGEENTEVKIAVYRENGAFFEVELTRLKFETKSVHASVSELDPEVGIVSISSFDLKTPSQFKQAVDGLRASGIRKFVFDLRKNPGGDLRSIKAVMSYFLQDGDLILQAIDRNGAVAASYVAEAITHEGDYAECSVSAEELGMYADLDKVVLCDGNTASAAEVFVATMQDYGLAEVVGTQTFGKGVMQATKRVPFGNMVGYIKLTTYAYQTKRGVSYHGEGITPDVFVEKSEAEDEQLKTAVGLLSAADQ